MKHQILYYSLKSKQLIQCETSYNQQPAMYHTMQMNGANLNKTTEIIANKCSVSLETTISESMLQPAK